MAGYPVMQIKISTKVQSGLETVKAGFDSSLFMSLNPPFPPVRLLKFDGCKTGDEVALELNFLLFKQRWISKITEDDEDEKSWEFVDEGYKLPFFLKQWKHHHQVKSIGSGSLIIDHIHFSTGYFLSDFILWPALFFQFLYRKPVYKKRFKSQ